VIGYVLYRKPVRDVGDLKQIFEKYLVGVAHNRKPVAAFAFIFFGFSRSVVIGRQILLFHNTALKIAVGRFYHCWYYVQAEGHLRWLSNLLRLLSAVTQMCVQPSLLVTHSQGNRATPTKAKISFVLRSE